MWRVEWEREQRGGRGEEKRTEGRVTGDEVNKWKRSR